ncbi:MAG: hypothetical protein KJN81_08050 [Acidimicrobiia bacterium]|nr:hypothetical protein [Acidimicrobiia bacterium]NNC43687.1 hypothetical protein [Acidimicrobiia bacterium]NND12866.1 hypothetical protein [Acidimicrobiia bacterium]NNL28365.1 hypothetical protein [Acidimicrobiia bacterium]
MHHKKLWLLLACLLLAGCRVDADIEARINSDGTGLLNIVVEADEEFLNNYALTGRDFDLELRRRVLSEPGMQLVESTDLSWHVQGRTDTPDEMEQLLEALSPAFERIAIQVGDRQSFTVEFIGFAEGEEIEEVLKGIDVSEINTDVDVSLSVYLPGEVISQNGELAADEESVTWSIGNAGRQVLFAETDVSSFPLWVVMVVIVSTLGGWFLRSVFGFLEERTGAVTERDPDLPKAA